MSKRHNYSHNPQEWLDHVVTLRGEMSLALLKTGIALYDKPAEGQLHLHKALGIADILLNLKVDTETIATVLAYPALQANYIELDSVSEIFGEGARKLLRDISHMKLLGTLQDPEKVRKQQHIENLRKMLLAIVTDVRVILIVLAERLWKLHETKNASRTEQIKLAKETLEIYAPLANRLGVWKLKWEIEDLCLRYLEPEIYNKIAKWLASRRDEREAYLSRVIEIVTDLLTKSHLKHFQITGRAKHIYSIYKKMLRKNASFEKIYDVSAVRILVDTIEDCYSALSYLQNTWLSIPEEFDDYIHHPKPNGYRSIHTVFKGPEEHFIEIQIRTHEMHHESEHGVAAHWRYKEGILQTGGYEAKIALLRQIMAWQQENTSQLQDLFADRVYVFTPTGDIVDLPQGATPLDFAYQIHSEVGHRCRGAKVNGHIVPLTYTLQTGERVEILTSKEPNPSRDWANPHLNFLKTARARAKVLHWFRLKEPESTPPFAPEQTQQRIMPTKEIEPIESGITEQHLADHIQVSGIKNLLTYIARCCKPLPGDPIIGYITRNRGMSIHRRDCPNVDISVPNRGRLMEVTWEEKDAKAMYPVDLLVRVFDRSALLRDLTTLLSAEKVNVLGLRTEPAKQSSEVNIFLTIEIAGIQQLTHAIQLLQQIPNVIEVRRR